MSDLTQSLAGILADAPDRLILSKQAGSKDTGIPQGHHRKKERLLPDCEIHRKTGISREL